MATGREKSMTDIVVDHTKSISDMVVSDNNRISINGKHM